MYNLVDKQTGNILATDVAPSDCWQVRDGVAEWVLASDQAKTKSERLAELSEEYNPQIYDLQTRIAIAVSVTKNTTAETTLRLSLSDLQAEYNTKRVAILNG